MKVLFITENKDIARVFIKIFQTNLVKFTLDCVLNFDEGIEYLKNNKTPMFTIVDTSIKEELSDIFIRVSQLTDKRPVILIASEGGEKQNLPIDFFSVNSANGVIKRPLNMTQAMNVFRAVLKGIHDDMIREQTVDIKKEDCIPIKIRNFYRFKKMKYDVFLELSETKFVKVINKNEEFFPSLIDKFVRKGVKFLYLEKKEHLQFIETSIDSLLRIFKTAKLAPENIFLAQINATSIIHEHIRTIGVSDKIVVLAKKVISSTSKNYDQFKSVKEMLKCFPFKEKDLPEQAILTSYLSEALLRALGWSSDMSKMKLGLASILHDAPLSNDDLIKISSLEDPNLAMFTEDEQEEYRTHTLKAAQLALDFPGFSEVDFIIAQHHELPSGKGFPRKLNSNQITALSCVFIVVNNFVAELSQKGISRSSVDRILDSFSTLYNEGNFKAPIKSLKDFLK